MRQNRWFTGEKLWLFCVLPLDAKTPCRLMKGEKTGYFLVRLEKFGSYLKVLLDNLV